MLLLYVCLQSTFIAAHAQVSGTYTINSTVATGGTNFRSFTDAVAYMQSGLNGPIIFNVVAGTGPYVEQIYLNNTIGTTAANTITFNCNGVTLSFTSINTNSRAGVKLDNISYVTFDNLRIVPLAASQYGYGFHLLNNADNNVIRNCSIVLPTNATTPGNNEGIVINGNNGTSTSAGISNCDNNLVEMNTISGGGAGITLSSVPVSGPAVLMLGNRILRNSISDSYNSCIQLYYNDGTIIDGNDLQGGPHAVSTVKGIYLNIFDQNVKITNNRIHNFHIDELIWGSFIYGILNSAQATAGNVNEIANNLIYDFSSNGIQYGIASRFAPASYFNIYHNTISLDDQNIYGQETDGMYFEDISNVNLFNNIITISRLTSDWNYGIALEKIMPQVTSTRNVFYIRGADFINAVGSLANRDLTALSDWQKATGLDMQSVVLDPQYTDLAAFNFVPKAQPIDNMGLYVNINTDITGANRSPLNPDVGCYEFVTPACQTPVVPGSTTVLPDTVLCYGPKITLLLKDNSWGVGQTYTWQSASTDNGTYTDISNAVAYPALDVLPASTLYYRAVVTCLGNTLYSVPIRVIIHTKLSAGSYTINATQPTGGINFNSFSDAALAVQCGVTGPVVFNVAPGTGPYNEQLILPSFTNTPSETITFRGNGERLEFAATNSIERAVVKLNGNDYITIDSLNIHVLGSSFGYGIQFMGDADHNTIKRCAISLDTNVTTPGYAGIVMNNSAGDPVNTSNPSFCDSNTIDNNTIMGGYYGITCTSRTYFPPSNIPFGNVFIKNKIMDVCAHGIYLDGVAGSLIDSNDISQPKRTVLTNFNGIYVKQTYSYGRAPHAIQVSRNRIHDLMKNGKVPTLESHGVHFETVAGVAANPNIVCNNLIYNFGGIGRQYGVYSRSTNNLRVYHNTISLDDSTITTNTGIVTCGFALMGNLSVGTQFKNNSVSVRRSGLGTRVGMFINGNDSAFRSDYNNYRMDTAAGMSYIGFMGGKNYALLSDWRTVKKDSSSINIDPLYVSARDGDFMPTNIPFDDKGIGVGIPVDFNDSVRNTVRPDIGAHEFTICHPLSPLVATLDSLGIYAIRFSWTPVTNTTGYLVSFNGIDWEEPSSGPMGTSHTITGLVGRDTAGLVVQALGTRWDCPSVFSQRMQAQTPTDQVFIPNTFTPNGNGMNDVFRVYSNVVRTMHLAVYNQWGNKIFETSSVTGGWDGTYKGKPQPVGVYLYVATMQLTDNSNIIRKGTFNLVR